MANDTIVIRYTIELVVSSGGALSGHKTPANLAKPSVIQVTSPSENKKLSKEKTAPFDVNLVRSQVLYQAAQGYASVSRGSARGRDTQG